MTLILKFLPLFAGIFCLFVHAQAETIFLETVGTATGDLSIAANTFDNSGLTFSGDADTRTTTASTGYTGASGNRNVFITNTVDRFFQISGIDTSAHTDLALSFGHYKNTIAANNELAVEVSSNGTDWTALSYSRATGSGTANWILIEPTGSIPSTANLRIRFRQTSATPQFRVDDIKLTGTSLSTVVIDNTGTPASATIERGTSDAVLFGFRLTPPSSIDFTAVDVDFTGTATTSDLSNFRIVYDVNTNGAYDSGTDTIVSASAQSLAATMSFSISGQTGFSAARRYLLIADVASLSQDGATFTASLANTDVTTTGTESGSAAGNPMVLAWPVGAISNILDDYDGTDDLTYQTDGNWSVDSGYYKAANSIGAVGSTTPEHSYASYDLTGSFPSWTLANHRTPIWFGWMDLNRNTVAGWGSSQYASAMILAANNATFNNAGAQGYAIGYQETDNKLVVFRFDAGVRDGSTNLPATSTAIVESGYAHSDVDDVVDGDAGVNFYVELLSDGTWRVSYIAGAPLSAADAANKANYTGGTATSVSADNTYRGNTFKYAGWAYAHSSAAGNEAWFDNFGAGIASIPPTITTTDPVTAIAQTTATAGGTITDDGGSGVTARGVAWSTSTNPTTGDSSTSDGSGSGVFTSSVTGLTAGTTYYVRAYATNAVGTTYGDNVSFLTVPADPTLSKASSPTATSFLVNWDAVTGAASYRVDVATDKNFSSFVSGFNDATLSSGGTVTGLTADNHYYVRARSVNASGTSGNSDTQVVQLVEIPADSDLYTSPASDAGSTINEIFGTTNAAGLVASGSWVSATQILLLNSSGVTNKTIFYNGSAWKDADDADAGNTAIAVGKAFILKNPNGSADYIAISGTPRTTQPSVSMNAAGTYSLVTHGRTSATALSDLNLNPGAVGGFKTGTNSSQVDQIILINPTTGAASIYYYLDHPTDNAKDGWYDPAWNRVDATTIPSGRAFFIKRVSDSTFDNWTLPSE